MKKFKTNCFAPFLPLTLMLFVVNSGPLFHSSSCVFAGQGDQTLPDYSNYYIHLNGGGLISPRAQVDPSVYVAIGSRVEDNAIVKGNVRILGKARVGGYVLVTGDALDPVIITDRAYVRGNTNIIGSAKITGDALVEDSVQIGGEAFIGDKAHVFGNVIISDQSQIRGVAEVSGYAGIYERATISGGATVKGNSKISGKVTIDGSALIDGDVTIFDSAMISGNAQVKDHALIHGNAFIYDNAQIYDYAEISGTSILGGESRISGMFQSFALQGDDVVRFQATPNLNFGTKAALLEEIKRKQENLQHLQSKDQTLLLSSVIGAGVISERLLTHPMIVSAVEQSCSDTDKVAVPLSNPGMENTLTVMSEEQLQELVKKLYANKELHMEKKLDGCYGRAHYLSLKLEEQGISSAKAFMEVPGLYPRFFSSNTDKNQLMRVNVGLAKNAEWGFHVATVVLVRDSQRKIVPKILDPAFSDRPMTEEEWVENLIKDNPLGRFKYYWAHRYGIYSNNSMQTLRGWTSVNSNDSTQLTEKSALEEVVMELERIKE
ncbi:MAG: hypothetical protein HQK52_13140 [Oligoflexia bacterium]|nr:hypothetical protein [Oligoflexia bacterium]